MSSGTPHPDPTRNEVWDRYWARHEHATEVYPAVTDLLYEIRRVLPDPKGRRILEVGAGTGREGHVLAGEGARVILLDISQEALRLSRTLSSAPAFLRANALQTPFPDNTFDLIYHQGLLEHFRDPMPLLRENYRILRPGGWLLVDVPQRYHVYTLMKHALMAVGRWFAGWETEFSYRELRSVVEQAGFQVLHGWGYGMRPGLGYRILREVLKSAGIRLPLYPSFGPLRPLVRAWWRLTLALERRGLGPYIGVTVGVAARKPETPPSRDEQALPVMG